MCLMCILIIGFWNVVWLLVALLIKWLIGLNNVDMFMKKMELFGYVFWIWVMKKIVF